MLFKKIENKHYALILVILTMIGGYLILLYNNSGKSRKLRKQPTSTCGIGGGGGGGGCGCSALAPVMDPKYNLREVCKQSILLEKHLFTPEERCDDCIRKHFLTIEGLVQEATTLDKKNECGVYTSGLAKKIQELEKQYINGREPSKIAQSLREIRKPLSQFSFEIF